MKSGTGNRQRQANGSRKFVSNRHRHLAGNSNPYQGQLSQHTLCPEVAKALSGVMLIAEQKKRLEESTKVRLPTKTDAIFIRRDITNLYIWPFLLKLTFCQFYYMLSLQVVF